MNGHPLKYISPSSHSSYIIKYRGCLVLLNTFTIIIIIILINFIETHFGVSSRSVQLFLCH